MSTERLVVRAPVQIFFKFIMKNVRRGSAIICNLQPINREIPIDRIFIWVLTSYSLYYLVFNLKLKSTLHVHLCNLKSFLNLKYSNILADFF